MNKLRPFCVLWTKSMFEGIIEYAIVWKNHALRNVNYHKFLNSNVQISLQKKEKNESMIALRFESNYSSTTIYK